MGKVNTNKNCHEYCIYAKCCRYAEGSNGLDPFECAMYYKLDDLAQDAREIAAEQRRAFAREFGVDESEVDDFR